MFESEIAEADITEVICSGDIIAEYPHDVPYPSYLLLGFRGNAPLHVLIGKNDNSGNCYVVTTYVPSRDIWSDDYKTRRNHFGYFKSRCDKEAVPPPSESRAIHPLFFSIKQL